MGPPWLKEGWFHAHALYARSVTDAGAQSAIGEVFARRVKGGYTSAIERVNLERRLVSLLTRGCERAPIGYTLRREAVNDSYSEGVENVGYDTQAGLGSGVFFRTVKLKDFPWNGWLRVVAGIPGEEATVKTFRAKGDTVTLIPANETMAEMVFRSDEVEVYGKVVTVLRRL